MKFCDKCGGLVIPVKGQNFSQCRNCKTKYENFESEIVTELNLTTEEEEIKILDGSEPSDFRTTDSVTCPNCGHNKAEWTLRQMRSSDEPPTQFYRCLNCKRVWRVNR
ncbi:MAG TPA: transcription factor S [archaeon]|nr:transcription factor S [archaeon]